MLACLPALIIASSRGVKTNPREKASVLHLVITCFDDYRGQKDFQILLNCNVYCHKFSV
jgi:hypothetical protein